MLPVALEKVLTAPIWVQLLLDSLYVFHMLEYLPLLKLPGLLTFIFIALVDLINIEHDLVTKFWPGVVLKWSC